MQPRFKRKAWTWQNFSFISIIALFYYNSIIIIIIIIIITSVHFLCF